MDAAGGASGGCEDVNTGAEPRYGGGGSAIP